MHPFATRVLTLLCLTAGACSQTATEPAVKPVMANANMTPPEDTKRAATPKGELAHLNAELAKLGVRETIGGIEVDDPFRALEQDSPQTRAWLDAQSKQTEAALAAARDPAAEARLAELLAIGQLGSASLAGSRVFFTLREGKRERPALYMLDLRAPSAAVSPDQPLIDPEAYGERASFDFAVPSYDGKYVAFGVSESGDERATLRVFDVAARKALPDAITRAKWSSIEWLSDGKGFYYTRYPQPGEPDWNEREPESYFPRVFHHQLGADPAKDPLVFGGDKPVDFPSVSLDDGDRYLAINNERSWTATDLWLWDRGKSAAGRPVVPPAGALKPVVRDRDNLTRGGVHRGKLLLLTNIDAPRKRVVRVDPAQAGDLARWRTLVPEGKGAIEQLVVTRDFLVTHAIEDVRSKLQVYDLEGKSLGEVPLPMAGTVVSVSGERTSDEIVFVFSSFFHPPTLYRYDLRARKLSELYRVKSSFDASAYELVQQSVISKDGTPINVFYGKQRGAAASGNTPVLLYGYGGFDVSLLPEFTRSALYWLERGGIYAVANLRGGGELGESWHRAGMLEQKHHVFEDFEAAIGWFSSSGLSNPSKIAITGGSNGGLLMGAMLTRVPAAFAAAASYVGLYDMLRYPLFPPAALWTSEYGDPQQPEMARYLLSYSPYHRVEAGVKYPAALIETADHDTRVFWGHSAKFAARLQSASEMDPSAIHFYLERAVGHGRGTGLADLVHRQARQLAFLNLALRLDSAASAAAGASATSP